ncbi:hypothetical protein [Pseudomonas citronellolis]|uniref:hypothetical protein n=1 Tax=Pseudomonas citronellolis TaxID=53408 RepID=UPI002FDA970E
MPATLYLRGRVEQQQASSFIARYRREACDVRLTLPPKMVERTLWALWWLLLVGASFWLLVGSVSYWVKHHYLPADASGWVQAIGAILAILVAVLIPLYQLIHEHSARVEMERTSEVARSEQLLVLCREAVEIVDGFDDEEMFADYDITDEMQRTVLTDLLARLTNAQQGKLNADRMKVGMRLRLHLHNWLKFFSQNRPIQGGGVTREQLLHGRVQRLRPMAERIRDEAENILRQLKSQPLIDTSGPEAPANEPPW